MTKETSASEEVIAACPDAFGADILKTDVLGGLLLAAFSVKPFLMPLKQAA